MTLVARTSSRTGFAWPILVTAACVACQEARVVDAGPPPLGAPEEPTPAVAPALLDDAGVAPTSPRGCAVEMAEVGAGGRPFCVDRFEAHLVTRAPSGELGRHRHDRRPEPGVRYEARSASGEYPQAYVNRPEAAEACANAGKRLCSLAEWERACSGAARAVYPYGDRWQKGRCNTHKPHLVTLLFGADARRWSYEQFNDPALDDEPGFLGRAGDHPDCANEGGVQDLVGNLHEWVSDTADVALNARLANDGVRRQWQPLHGGNGVFVGGFFSTGEEHGPGCRFITAAHEPEYHDYSTGFRCCADAFSRKR